MILKIYQLKQYKKYIKVLLHKMGQFFIAHTWNFLPGANVYDFLKLAVVLTKKCNANCIFCAYQFMPASERIDMPDEIFFKIVDNVKKLRIPHIFFTSTSGEPLLAPNLLEKISVLRQAGVQRIELTTNAILLDQFGINEFLSNGPDIINISTTAFDAYMYKRIFRSEQYERMRKNVMRLLTENKHRNKPRYITIGIRPDISKKDILAMPEMQKIFNLLDELNITEAYDDWLGLIKEPLLSGLMKLEKPNRLSRRPCQILVTIPAVYPSGNVVACVCRNIHNDPELYLGNILEIDLETALRRIDEIALDWCGGIIPKTCFSCAMYGDPSYYWPAYLKRLFLKCLKRNK